MTENILTDGHCLSPYTCKSCIAFKQFDGFNFDGLAGKRQKRQNFPRKNFALYGMYKIKHSALGLDAKKHLALLHAILAISASCLMLYFPYSTGGNDLTLTYIYVTLLHLRSKGNAIA